MNKLLTICIRRRERFSIRKERALQQLLAAALKAADIARHQVQFVDGIANGSPAIEFVGPSAPDLLRRIIIGQNSPNRRLFRMVAALSFQDLATRREAAAARPVASRRALAGSRSGLRSVRKEVGV